MQNTISEKKFVAKEGTTINDVRKYGSTGQQYAVGIFDVDYDGKLNGNEVELFNSCNFKYDKSNGQLTIYDNQVKNNGKNGTIIINAYDNSDYYGDVVKDDMSSYDVLLYEMDCTGNRRLSDRVNNSCRKTPWLSGFDKIEFHQGKTNRFDITGKQESFWGKIKNTHNSYINKQNEQNRKEIEEDRQRRLMELNGYQ